MESKVDSLGQEFRWVIQLHFWAQEARCQFQKFISYDLDILTMIIYLNVA